MQIKPEISKKSEEKFFGATQEQWDDMLIMQLKILDEIEAKT